MTSFFYNGDAYFCKTIKRGKTWTYFLIEMPNFKGLKENGVLRFKRKSILRYRICFTSLQTKQQRLLWYNIFYKFDLKSLASLDLEKGIRTKFLRFWAFLTKYHVTIGWKLTQSHARTHISINVLIKRWNGTFNVLFQRPERHPVKRVARDLGPAIVLRLWRNLPIPSTFPSPLYVLLLKLPILSFFCHLNS